MHQAILKLFVLNFLLFLIYPLQAQKTEIVSAYGYKKCIRLSNEKTEVIINPGVGGRIMRYAIDGKNIIQENPAHDGWVWDGTNMPPGKYLAGGRFDIGPSKFRSNQRKHWFGPWSYEITREAQVVLVSERDEENGIQLKRTFKLHKKSSALKIEQEILNISNEKLRLAHWGRAFLKAGGTLYLPVNPRSKYPKGFAMYLPNRVVNFNPGLEETVTIANDHLVISGPFSQQKIDMDLAVGRVSYFFEDLLFRNTFEVHPAKPYGDITAANFSTWYNGLDMVEIEPIGPWEWIEPGESISFAENWQLVNVPAWTCNEEMIIHAAAFSGQVAGYVPAYFDHARNAMAVNSVKYPDQYAASEMISNYPDGLYDMSLTSLTETDGESSYQLWINDKMIGQFQNPESEIDYQEYSYEWKSVSINKGDVIRVASIAHTNGKVPEKDGTAYARGRWRSLSLSTQCKND